MNNLDTIDSVYTTPTPAIEPTPSSQSRPLQLFTGTIVVMALVAAVVLLAGDIFLHMLPHAPVSAVPLLLIGVAYLTFQALTRPSWLDLCKAFIVSTAFILWGVDQMLPGGWFATFLGDVVITLYVIDLGWMMIDRLYSSMSRP